MVTTLDCVTTSAAAAAAAKGRMCMNVTDAHDYDLAKKQV